MEYILSNKRDGCVFCDAFGADPSGDRETLIVHRGRHAAVIMNLYPYNNGHLMVAPCSSPAPIPRPTAALSFACPWREVSRLRFSNCPHTDT